MKKLTDKKKSVKCKTARFTLFDTKDNVRNKRLKIHIGKWLHKIAFYKIFLIQHIVHSSCVCKFQERISPPPPQWTSISWLFMYQFYIFSNFGPMPLLYNSVGGELCQVRTYSTVLEKTASVQLLITRNCSDVHLYVLLTLLANTPPPPHTYNNDLIQVTWPGLMGLPHETYVYFLNISTGENR